MDEEVGSSSHSNEEATLKSHNQAGSLDEESPAPKEKVPETDPNIVTWNGPDDPANPMNFTRARKWRITTLTSLMTFCVSFASSIFSTATFVTAEEFGVSSEVMILGVSLYVLGFATGPLVWGPLSEAFGRTQPLFIGFALFIIFNIPVAVAQNVETVMLARFLSGCFGAAPIAICSGMSVDYWDPIDRGVSSAGFAGATFVGPVAGPIVGEFITASYLGWRWTAWIVLIVSVFFGILGLLVIPETFAPILLKRKAQRLRQETKNWALHAPIDEHPVTMRSLFETYFTKPWIMFVQEPILVVLTIYMSLVYSVQYLIFFAYPYAFEVKRGWKPGVGSLPFLAILIGLITCCIIVAVDTKTRFQRALIKSKKPFLPEARLPPMILGSFILPIGLFWFAWTSNPHISWVPQVLSGALIGCGILLVFLPGLLYIVDVYLLNANSALAANSCIRAAMAAAFPLFAGYMYQRLDVAWATSLLAFLAVAMIPFPILFYKYGNALRAKGKYTFDL